MLCLIPTSGHTILLVFSEDMYLTRVSTFFFPSCFQFACSHCYYYKCECISQRALSFRFYFTTLTQW